MWMPSGASATVNPYWVEIRRHTPLDEAETVRDEYAPHHHGRRARHVHQRHHGDHEGDEHDAPRHQHRPDQAVGGHLGHELLGGLGRIGIDPVVSGEKAGAEISGHLVGEVGQPSVGRARPGQADTQLGQTEEPGHEGLDHVHRLDPGHRELAGVATQQTALDPQRRPVEHPLRHQPMDEAGRRPRREWRWRSTRATELFEWLWPLEPDTTRASRNTGTIRPARTTGVMG